MSEGPLNEKAVRRAKQALADGLADAPFMALYRLALQTNAENASFTVSWDEGEREPGEFIPEMVIRVRQVTEETEAEHE